MPAAMLTPDRPPPEDYYQNNCLSLFGFVLQHYAMLLDDHTAAALQVYLNLSDDAQRLFARLLTRKPIVRLDSLHYAEVDDLTGALEALVEANLICINAARPADQLLALLRKAELMALDDTLPGRLRKVEMIAAWLSRYSDAQIRDRVARLSAWVSIAEPQTWQLVQLLYFGDSEHDWSSFVVRDLGMVDYEPVAMRSKRYADRQALEQDLHYRHLSHLSHRITEHPGLSAELVSQLWGNVNDRLIEARRARALLRIGQWHERIGDSATAVSAYQQAAAHPARERIVRTLHKQGDEQSAARWLQTIREAPLSEEEAQFAERFGKRQAGYQPPTTTIDIAAARDDIEAQAMELILEPGMWGAHVENSLVRTLTGLVYWRAIFADIPGAFTNPFQFGPNDLYSSDFCAPRARIMAEIESELGDDAALRAHLLAIAAEKQNIANSLVNWSLLRHIALSDFLDAMPMAHVRTLTQFMIRHLNQCRKGLPDLFIAKGPGQYEFVEVKGPNDQLQPGQRVWFKHFDRLGIPARVVKLRLKS